MFKSQAQRRYLEMIAHNPEKANKSVKDIDSIKKFVSDAEQAPQPKIEAGKPKKFGKLMGKLKKYV